MIYFMPCTCGRFIQSASITFRRSIHFGITRVIPLFIPLSFISFQLLSFHQPQYRTTKVFTPITEAINRAVVFRVLWLKHHSNMLWVLKIYKANNPLLQPKKPLQTIIADCIQSYWLNTIVPANPLKFWYALFFCDSSTPANISEFLFYYIYL